MEQLRNFVGLIGWLLATTVGVLIVAGLVAAVMALVAMFVGSFIGLILGWIIKAFCLASGVC